jgi:hypothetical protein
MECVPVVSYDTTVPAEAGPRLTTTIEWLLPCHGNPRAQRQAAERRSGRRFRQSASSALLRRLAPTVNENTLSVPSSTNT